MADIMLEKPLAGAQNIVDSAAGSNITLGFPIADATLERSGNDLIFHFEDGSSVVLRDFYTAYTKDTMPDFVIDGAPVSGEEFFTALNDQDLMPAAGPAASASSAAGGRFHEFTDDPLQNGVDRLDGLDLSSNRAFYPERDPFGGALDGDSTAFGGTDNPLDPTNPDTPDVPEPLTPNTPPTVSVTGTIGVIEAGVHPGGNVVYAGTPESSGKVTATDADGDSLNFGFLDADGNQVTEIVTDYGTVTMQPDGTYTYTLDNADPDTNSLALGESREETFTVFVDDGNGGVTTQEITVTIVGTNDRPTLELSAPALDVIESGVGRDGADNVITSNIPAEENAPYLGKLTSGTGQAQGADVDHGAVLTYGAASGVTDDPLDSYFTATDSTQGSSSVTAGGTYGDLILNNDGSYSYTLHPETDANINSLHEGEVVTETFTVYVRDEHGAWSKQELTVNITGTNDRPEISAVDSLVLKETGVQDGGNTPTTPDGAVTPEGGAHRLTATGHVTADDVDNDDDAGTLRYSFDNGQTNLSSDLGDISIDQNGNYTYQLKDGAANSLAQGEIRTESFTVMVTDSHGATHEAVVNVTIYGTNDIPTLSITGNGQNLLEPTGDDGDKLVVGGDFNVTDLDNDAGQNQSFHIEGTPIMVDGVPYETTGTPSDGRNQPGTDNDVSASFTTEYGTLTLDPATNTWKYELNPDSPQLQGLNDGDTKVEHFTVTVTDEHGATSTETITVTITGTNDVPRIEDSAVDLKEMGVHSGGNDATTSDGTIVPEGTGHKTTVEGQIIASDLDAENGGMMGVNGAPSTDWNDHHLTFSVEHAGTTLNDNAADGGIGKAQSPTEGDPKSGIYTYESQYGTLTVHQDGSYTYTLKNDSEDGTADTAINKLAQGDTLTETFTVTVTDAQHVTNTATITINIYGTNDVPLLHLGETVFTLVEDSKTTVSSRFEVEDADADSGTHQIFSITGGTTDRDGKTYSTNGDAASGHNYTGTDNDVSATFKTAYGTLTLDPATGEWTYKIDGGSSAVQALNKDNPHYETFNVTVTDEHGATDTKTITIKIEGTNNPTVINADNLLTLKEEGVYNGNTGTGELGPDEHIGDRLNTGEFKDNFRTTVNGKIELVSDVDDDISVGIGTGDNQFHVSLKGEHGNGTYQYALVGDRTASGKEFDLANLSADVKAELMTLLGVDESGLENTLKGLPIGKFVLNPDGSYSYTLATDGMQGADDFTAEEFKAAAILLDTLPETSGADGSGNLLHSFLIQVMDPQGDPQDIRVETHIYGTNDKPTLKLGHMVDGTFVSDTTLDVTEKGVGRDIDGNVIHSKDDPSGSGSDEAELENQGYPGKWDDSNHAFGKDADTGAELQYGVVFGGGKDTLEPGASFAAGGTDGTADGRYGTLTINADGKYGYLLDEGKAFSKDGHDYTINNLNEDEKLDETFTIYVKDEHGAWAKQEITVTITGTNDKPTLTVPAEVTFYDVDGKLIDSATSLRESGFDAGGNFVNAINTIEGRVFATDDDQENGSGAVTTATDNHGLEFSLIRSTSEWSGGDIKDPNATPTQATPTHDSLAIIDTKYGTLTLDQYGNYIYTMHDGAAAHLGAGETATETILVRVMDARGAYDDEPITITITGTNDRPILFTKKSSVSVIEEGVAGDAYHPGMGPNDPISGTGIATGTVKFEDKDDNDNHTLIFDNDTMTQLQGGTLSGKLLPTGDNVTFIVKGVTQDGFELYYNIKGQDVFLGTVTLNTKISNTEIQYTFTPSNDGHLPDILAQNMNLSFDLGLRIKDQHGLVSGDKATATITIEGTNDRPEIRQVTETNADGTLILAKDTKSVDIFASGVGRDDKHFTIGDGDKDNALHSNENTEYGGKTAYGKIIGTDADLGARMTYHIKGEGVDTSEKGFESVKVKVGDVDVAILKLNTDDGTYTFRFLEQKADALSDDQIAKINETLAKYSEGQNTSKEITFEVWDEHRSTGERSVSFNIFGTNDKPEITLDGKVVEDNSHVLDLVVSEDGKNTDQGTSASRQVGVNDADTGPADTHRFGLISKGDHDALTGEKHTPVTPTMKIEGEYGTLTMNADGTYTYNLKNGIDEVQELHPVRGDEKETEGTHYLEETFYVTVRDNHGAYDIHPVTVRINGTEDAPVVDSTSTLFLNDLVESGVKGGNVQVDGTLIKTGKVQGRDMDSGDEASLTYTFNTEKTISEKVDDGVLIQSIDTQYGTVTLNTKTGEYTYTLDDAKSNILAQDTTGQDTFKVNITDPAGLSAVANITVNVTGTNDRPFFTQGNDEPIKGEDGSVQYEGVKITSAAVTGDVIGNSVKGTLTGNDYDSDNDPNDLKFCIVKDGKTVDRTHGNYGILVVHGDGSYTYELTRMPDGAKEWSQDEIEAMLGKEHFTVRVTDKWGAYSDATLNIAFKGTDDAPTVENSSATVYEDNGKLDWDKHTDPLPFTTGKLTIKTTDTDDAITPPMLEVNGKGSDTNNLVIDGKYGTLSLNKITGEYTYTLKGDTNKDIQGYAENELFAEDVFTVTGKTHDEGKGFSGTITIDIRGTNDRPKLESVGDEKHNVKLDDTTSMVIGDDREENTTIHADDIDSDDDAGSLNYYFKDKAGVLHLNIYKSQYGTFQIVKVTDADGKVTEVKYLYTVDNENQALRTYLDTNHKAVEEAEIVVIDRHGAMSTTIPVRVTIEPADSGGSGHGGWTLTFDADSPLKGDVQEDGLPQPEKPGQDPNDEIAYDQTFSGKLNAVWTKPGEAPQDASAPEAVFGIQVGENSVQTEVRTPYGTLYIDPVTGKYTFTLDNDSPEVQKLAAGQEQDLSFTPTLNGKPIGNHEIIITIHGTNDAPTVTKVENVELSEAEYRVSEDELTKTGNLEGKDVDLTKNPNDGNTLDAPKFVIVDAGGNELTPDKDGWFLTTHGKVQINSDGKSYTYILTETEHHHDGLTDSFYVAAKDEYNALSAPKEVTVTVTGQNDAPKLIKENAELIIKDVKEDNEVVREGKIDAKDYFTDDTQSLNVTFHLWDYENDHLMEYKTEDGSLIETTFIKGTYGTLVLKPDGNYSYQLDNSLSDVQALGEGVTRTETFHFVAKDAEGALSDPVIVKVTITGTNDKPVLSVDSHLSIKADGVSVEGVAAVTDTDMSHMVNGVEKDGSGEQTFTVSHNATTVSAGESIEGLYGRFTIGSDGKYTYTLYTSADGDKFKAVQEIPEGVQKTDTFTITVTDVNGGTDFKDVTVTVTGTNDAPVFTVDTPGTILSSEISDHPKEPLSGQLKATDADTGDADNLSYSLVGGATYIEGKYGTLTLKPDGHYTYTLTKDLSYLGEGKSPAEAEVFEVVVKDSHGAEDTAQLHINIVGTNDTPKINSTSFDAAAGVGTLTFSDVDTSDTHTVTFDGLHAGGEGNPDLKVELDTLVNGKGSVDVYNADGDKIGTMDLEFAKGSGDQDTLKYTFKPNADYENSLAVNASEHLDFTVSVADGSLSDTTEGKYEITITNENDAPMIGSSSFNTGTGVGTLTFSDVDTNDTHSVTFDGLRDSEGNALKVELGTLPGGKGTVDVYKDGVKIGKMDLEFAKGTGDQDTLKYTFTPDGSGIREGEPVELDFTLVVKDASGAHDSGGEHAFTVTGTNEAPEIGTVMSGDNTGSLRITDADTNNDALSITVALGGSQLTLSGATMSGTVGGVMFTYDSAAGELSYAVDKSVTDALTPDGTGELVFSVSVNDGLGATVTPVTLPLTSTNTDPYGVQDTPGTVNDGDHSVSGTLSATDDEGQDLTYAVKGSSESAYGKLTLNSDGTYTYKLTGDPKGVGEDSFTVHVSDGHGGLAEHTLTFDLSDLNKAPVLDGDKSNDTDKSIAIGAEQVEGTLHVTDDNGDNLSVVTDSFTTGKGAAVTATIDNGVIKYTYALGESPESGKDSFTLTVSDGYGGTAEITVNVDISAAVPHAMMFRSFSLMNVMHPVADIAPDTTDTTDTPVSNSEDVLPGQGSEGHEQAGGENGGHGSDVIDLTDVVTPPSENHGTDVSDSLHPTDVTQPSDENGLHGHNGQDGVTDPADPLSPAENASHPADGTTSEESKESASSDGHESHALDHTVDTGTDAHTLAGDSSSAPDNGQDAPETYALFGGDADDYDVPLYGPIEASDYGDGSHGNGYYGDDEALANIGGDVLAAQETLDGYLPVSSEAGASSSVEALDADTTNGLNVVNGSTTDGSGVPAQMPGLIPADAVVDQHDIAVGVVTGSADVGDDNLAHAVAIHQQQNGNG